MTFVRQSEKRPDGAKNLVRLLVMKPVPCTGYRLGAGLLEIAGQSRGAFEEALLCVQQQSRAGDARPERNVIVRRQPVRRHGALAGIEFPAVGVVCVSPHAKRSEVLQQFGRQARVASPHLRGRRFDRAIAARFAIFQSVELADPFRDPFMRRHSFRVRQDRHAVENHQP